VKLCVDTNVFLNVIRDEPSFSESSGRLLRLIHSGEITGCTSTLTLMEVKLALHRQGEGDKGDLACALVEDIAALIPVDREVAIRGIDLNLGLRLDLFDSLHVASSESWGAVFVTRDETLRKRASGVAPILSPEEALERHDRGTR
jgi:predicted nucleic acid-binding protein